MDVTKLHRMDPEAQQDYLDGLELEDLAALLETTAIEMIGEYGDEPTARSMALQILYENGVVVYENLDAP